MRTKDDVRRDLNRWEIELDKHLAHCPTCEEAAERYCAIGCELSILLTRLLMEKMRFSSDPREIVGAGSGTADRAAQVT